MLNVLSAAMKIKPRIKLDQKPRMADYAVWGCAIAEALGIGMERFLEAYNGNIERQNEEALYSSMVAQAIVEFMKTRNTWKGTATELLSELDTLARNLRLNARGRALPKRRIFSPPSHSMNNKITLRKAGVEFEMIREGKGVRQILLSRSTKEASVPSEASPRFKWTHPYAGSSINLYWTSSIPL